MDAAHPRQKACLWGSAITCDILAHLWAPPPTRCACVPWRFDHLGLLLECPRVRYTDLGFDHGAGHPLLFLDDTKAPNCRKNNRFNGLGNYAE